VTFQKGTNNKTADVRIRFTPDEKEQAKANAKEAGLTLSEYIRRRALGLPVRSKADAQMINELRRLGGLVKHIHNESAGVNSKETAGVLVEIIDAIKRIGS
jgi:antitoxin component of RelBE/YafQ-DinJ toxin-antitoxin module